MNIQAKNKLTQSPLFLIAPFFFLGTAMVVMKSIIPHTTPMFLAAFRLLPAGLIILAVAAIFKLPQPKTWKAWLWILIFGIVDGAMFQGFLSEGLVYTRAGLGAVLIDAQPLIVAILSRFLLADVIGFWGWLGLAFGILGVSLCGLPDDFIYNFQGNLDSVSFNFQGLMQNGELLMILAALSMSFGTIIVRYVKKYADPIVATGWHMIIGAIPLIAISLWFESNQVSLLNGTDWVGLGYATVFGTALTYGIFFYLAATGNVTSVSALIFLTPIFALLFANLTLGEELSVLEWIGVVFTLISVYLVNQREQITAWFSRKSGDLSLEELEKVQPGLPNLTEK